MAYATGNPRTKKQLKEWVAEGKSVTIFSPGPFPPRMNGTETIEGPHSSHSWYAQVTVEGGVITKVK